MEEVLLVSCPTLNFMLLPVEYVDGVVVIEGCSCVYYFLFVEHH